MHKEQKKLKIYGLLMKGEIPYDWSRQLCTEMSLNYKAEPRLNLCYAWDKANFQ